MKNYTKLFLDEIKGDEKLSFDEIKATAFLDDTAMDSVDDEVIVDMDNIDLEKSCKYDKAIHNFLNALSVPDDLIEDVMSEDDELSRASILELNPFIEDNPIDMDSIDYDGVATDGIIPQRKAGYSLKRVVRDGKLVWRNIRKKGKRVVLTLKQKLALKKLHNKLKTPLSKYKQSKSLKLREKLGL